MIIAEKFDKPPLGIAEQMVINKINQIFRSVIDSQA